MGVLYKLTAPNGKAYIGISSKGLDARWTKHVEHAMGKRSAGALYAALRKYGVDNFHREVLAEEADWATLCEMEKRAIQEHGSLSPGGYNMTLGGEGTLGPISEKARANVAAAQKKRFERPEERRRLKEASMRALPKLIARRNGAVVSCGHCAREIYRAAWQLKQSERFFCSHLCRHAYVAMHGQPRRPDAPPRPPITEETRAKHRAAARARADDPEWRQKISKAKTGKTLGPQSEEHRQRISEARKREWADPIIRAKRLAALARARAALEGAHQ